MIDIDGARDLLLKTLKKNEQYTLGDDEYMISQQQTVEKWYGWIFAFTTRKYMETLDPRYALLGTGGVIVNKFDQSLHFLPSLNRDKAIDEYEASLDHNLKE